MPFCACNLEIHITLVKISFSDRNRSCTGLVVIAASRRFIQIIFHGNLRSGHIDMIVAFHGAGIARIIHIGGFRQNIIFIIHGSLQRQLPGKFICDLLFGSCA